MIVSSSLQWYQFTPVSARASQYDTWRASPERLVFRTPLVPCTAFVLLDDFLLTGGPGFEAPRPVESSSWIKSATAHFKVLLMDQRGTGCSSAITAANLAAKGSAEQQASYLKHFRYTHAHLCICIFMQAYVQTSCVAASAETYWCQRSCCSQG